MGLMWPPTRRINTDIPKKSKTRRRLIFQHSRPFKVSPRHVCASTWEENLHSHTCACKLRLGCTWRIKMVFFPNGRFSTPCRWGGANIKELARLKRRQTRGPITREGGDCLAYVHNALKHPLLKYIFCANISRFFIWNVESIVGGSRTCSSGGGRFAEMDVYYNTRTVVCVCTFVMHSSRLQVQKYPGMLRFWRPCAFRDELRIWNFVLRHFWCQFSECFLVMDRIRCGERCARYSPHNLFKNITWKIYFFVSAVFCVNEHNLSCRNNWNK